MEAYFPCELRIVEFYDDDGYFIRNDSSKVLSQYNLIRETDTLHNFGFVDNLDITLWITQIASWEIQTILMKVRNYPHLFHGAILRTRKMELHI